MKGISCMGEYKKDWDDSIKKEGRAIAPSVVFIILVTAAVFAGRFISWFFHNFGGINVSSIIYTLSASTEGKSPEIVAGAVRYVLPWIVAAFAVTLIITLVLLKKNRARKIISLIGIWASVIFIIGLVIYTAAKLDLVGYIKSETTTSSFIDDNYVDPDTVDIVFPEKKRNLIFIYVESMETSFADEENGGGKPYNVIPELTKIGLESEMFAGDRGILNGGYSLYGATYTMGGIFAQTAGLPLNSSAADISLSEGFLPGITTLGDILEKEGYHNVFCIGTSAAFADRDKYFKEHGNYDIMDYEYSVKNGEIPADYERPWWGYDDFTLYENAKKHLTELASSDEPFNFTMLTVDTHAEDGYLCELCGDEFGEDKYSNAMACASRQAADFISWIKEQDFYPNTTVVVTGDHVTMDSDYGDDMPKDYDRKIFSAFINAAAVPESSSFRDYSSMDIFPTTIAALGAQIRGNKLGLGTNLYSSETTLTEVYGKEEMNEKLAQKTEFFDNALGDKTTRTFDASYDDEEGVIHVNVDKDLGYDGEFNYLFCDVHLDETDLTERHRLTETEDAYEADIPLPFFDYATGNYVLTVYLMLPGDLPYWYASNNVILDEINYNYVPPLTLTVDENANTLTINYMPPSYIEYEAYWFPTWSDSGSASDLCWYRGERQSDGSYQYVVDLNGHKGGPTVTVHVYGGSGEGATQKLDEGTVEQNI